MSRSKQATQTPMLPGFPHFCKSGAKIPIMIPTPMMPQRPAKMFLIPLIEYLLIGMDQPLMENSPDFFEIS